MHSFDNGIGLMKRIQNWALLEKFFRKVNFPIERQTIENVIHCKPGAAIPLMEQLYTLLTHKTVQSSRPLKETEIIPPFARPTASQLIKERMSEADLADSHVLDASIAPSKAAAVLASHMHKLKIERETEPARFQPKSHHATNHTAATTTPAKRTGGQPVQFKEVQVKQVDDRNGVLNLRANHIYHQRTSSQQQQQFNSPSSPQPSHSQPFSSSSTNSPSPHHRSASSSDSASVGAPIGRPVLSILSQALLALIGDSTPIGQQLKAHDGTNKEPCLNYVGSLSAFTDEQNAGIIHQLHVQTVGHVVDASAHNPREFYLASGWLFSVLEHSTHDSQTFYQTLNFFTDLGLRLVQRDAYLSTQLWNDFAFARYMTLMRHQPLKIFQIAKLAYTFVSDTAQEHVAILENVRKNLGLSNSPASQDEVSLRLFYSILAALAPYENALLVANDCLLLTAYLRYVTDGLHTTNTARVRAVCLSVLAPLSANPNYGESVLRPILDKLRPLLPQMTEADENDNNIIGTGRNLPNNEWLVDAELVHVVSCVLNHDWIQASHATHAELVRWIRQLLEKNPCVPTILAGSSHLVHILGQQPTLRRLWLAPLVERAEVRHKILQIGSPTTTTTNNADESNYTVQTCLNVPPSALAPSTASSPSSGSAASDLVALFCPPLRSVWHPLTVCQTLADTVRIDRLDNLTVGHIELLVACCEDAFGSASHPTPFADAEAEEWSRVFIDLRDHLVVELCDPELSEAVIGILRRFLMDPRTSQAAQTIFLTNPLPQSTNSSLDPSSSSSSSSTQTPASSPPPLYCIMRFMFPDAGDEAQLNLVGFLDELAAHPTFTALVHRNVQVFAQTEPTKFQDSPLVNLLHKLDALAEQAGFRQ